MHHFGVLVPSTSTIVEIEYGRLLPPTLQVHVARIPLLSRGSDDTDVDAGSGIRGFGRTGLLGNANCASSRRPND
jgi:hypothetical protein